ncbi:hypothetical protein JOE38_001236 [Clavibacter michiganensis]|uniref:hypothetical protein n=1 Tax=Clavibacter michiganensis TaxID=28447 RepID=UPI0019584D0C|nr:hypothetical protein [Clavibacter michiganensis]MBM7411413.1 hypothetical protein [Clavibacter michiganensis]
MTLATFGSYAAAYATPLARLASDSNDPTWETPYTALRATTTKEAMRAAGTYFTSPSLAKALWDLVDLPLPDGAIVVDPAVGAGDLLLPSVTDHSVPDRGRPHSDKTTRPSYRINDTNPLFLQIAERRLAQTGVIERSQISSSNLDFLSGNFDLTNATHVVMNPPFFSIKAERPWGRGSINAAALFVERALLDMQDGSVLLAILPDVLRSGTRYAKWRSSVSALGSIRALSTQDQFDHQTDVHTFLIKIEVGAAVPNSSWQSSSDTKHTLQEYCRVAVGPVVPHRDSHDGDEVAYVTARSLTAGIPLTRSFTGRLEYGPMLLVNRTARPGDNPRVRVRRWTATTPTAVENHLLIVKPNANSGVTIDDALRVLQSEHTRTFLDERIRCRHLTVTALKEIPWTN